MHSFHRLFIALCIFAGALYSHAGDQKSSGFSTSSESQLKDSSQNRPSKPQTPDCTRSNTDPRCRPPKPPYYYPDHHPYNSRPVIINQLPPEPAIEIESLSDDWEGCRTAKLGSIRARNAGHAGKANDLDEWLWKNCRSYSYELRQLEQDDM